MPMKQLNQLQTTPLSQAIVINIQSISDIITNSSSEAYMTTNYDCVDSIKRIIDTLMGEGSSDNFDIKDDCDRIVIKAKSDDFQEQAKALSLVNYLFYATDDNY